MKAKSPHRVPLSSRALEILNAQKGQHEHLVFPSSRDQVELSDMAMTSLLRRLKIPSDTPDRIATAHGFRSSFRDWCSEQGYRASEWRVCEALLARMSPRMLCLADRGFNGYEHWKAASATGAHLLWRCQANHKLAVLKALADGS